MLARYLGSKQDILRPLLDVVSQHCAPGAHVADIFSGSLAVSMGLKQAGYRVTANDINLFSAVLADAYLTPCAPPPTDATILLPPQRRADYLNEARAITEQLIGTPGYSFLQDPGWRRDYEQFLAVQQHLMTLAEEELPVESQHHHFYDAYCEDGAHSAFVSSRGTTGRRRFFSPANAARIDVALNQIRRWRISGDIDHHTKSLLLATLMRAIEKISNTQGTYHDFPRTTWDSRALRPLKIEPPALGPMIAGAGGHNAGREQDSLDYITTIDDHSLLYLDPPYNFRQYTAYYFLPNVVCRYPDLDDPDEYFSKLAYVRGQNPDDDFASTFCKPRRFIEDMRTLISRARCETVMISYFTGRNHWSAFDSGPSDTGREMLSELLTGYLFEPGSLTVVAVPRRNYASYGGFRARVVDELLLVAQRRQDDLHGTSARSSGRLQPVA